MWKEGVNMIVANLTTSVFGRPSHLSFIALFLLLNVWEEPFFLLCYICTVCDIISLFNLFQE